VHGSGQVLMERAGEEENKEGSGGGECCEDVVGSGTVVTSYRREC
jgi:hypothetical protein